MYVLFIQVHLCLLGGNHVLLLTHENTKTERAEPTVGSQILPSLEPRSYVE